MAKNKKGKKKDNKVNKYIIAIFAIIVVAGIAGFLITEFPGMMEKIKMPEAINNKVIASVNGEEITEAQFNKEYEFFFFVMGYPEEYETIVTKEIFLNQTIAQMLFVQEAKKLGYTVTDEEIIKEIDDSLEKSGLDKTAFETNLADAGFNMKDVLEYSKKQKLIVDFMEDNIFSDTEISDKQAEEFYEENKELFATQGIESADEILEDIKNQLALEDQRVALEIALEVLMESADIEVTENYASEAEPVVPVEVSEEASE